MVTNKTSALTLNIHQKYNEKTCRLQHWERTPGNESLTYTHIHYNDYANISFTLRLVSHTMPMRSPCATIWMRE